MTKIKIHNPVLGVPITFLNYYNPEEWMIVDGANRYLFFDIFNVNKTVQEMHSHCCNVNNKAVYNRILIRRKYDRT